MLATVGVQLFTVTSDALKSTNLVNTASALVLGTDGVIFV